MLVLDAGHGGEDGGAVAADGTVTIAHGGSMRYSVFWGIRR